MQTTTFKVPRRPAVSLLALAAGLAALLGFGSVSAQSLTVLPVRIQLAPKQMVTSLTLINQGDAETSVQIRVLAWGQSGGNEELTPTDDVLISPPIATIGAGGTQVVRLVLGRKPQGRESTYRILVDQIPPASSPGTVRIALRLSIPVFAEPATRTAARMKYHIESKDGQATLVALNEGSRHETIRELGLTTSTGDGLNAAASASPYILAGATRRWPITTSSRVPLPGDTLRMTGRGEAGAVDRTIAVVAGR
jgi:fimbrial chaperone protein